MGAVERAAIVKEASETIEADDIRGALFPVGNSQKPDEVVLNRSLGNGFRLPDVIAEVARHYLKRAFVESKGNKTKIASLIGLPNYQTVSNWMKKYSMEE